MKNSKCVTFLSLLFYTLSNLHDDDVIPIFSFLFLQGASLLLFPSCLHFAALALNLAFISCQISHFHVYSILLPLNALRALVGPLRSGFWSLKRLW
jgi:hypothetical protein